MISDCGCMYNVVYWPPLWQAHASCSMTCKDACTPSLGDVWLNCDPDWTKGSSVLLARCGELPQFCTPVFNLPKHEHIYSMPPFATPGRIVVYGILLPWQKPYYNRSYHQSPASLDPIHVSLCQDNLRKLRLHHQQWRYHYVTLHNTWQNDRSWWNEGCRVNDFPRSQKTDGNRGNDSLKRKWTNDVEIAFFAEFSSQFLAKTFKKAEDFEDFQGRRHFSWLFVSWKFIGCPFWCPTLCANQQLRCLTQ